MNNNKLTLLTNSLILAAALITPTVNAAQAEIDQVEQASAQLNIKQLQTLTKELEGYDLALANYRLAVSANLTKQEDMAEKSLDQAMELLEMLDQEQPNDPEVKALLAQVYGYKIALSPIKGIVYGPKSQSSLSEAELIAPNNPRVQLIKGIGAVNTPPMFGGSSDKAMEAFSKAIEAYNNDQYSNYYWGHSEALTWRGMLHQQQGQTEKAMADWNKALEIDPNYGWAQSLIASSSK